MSPLQLLKESVLKSWERRQPRPIVSHELKLIYYPVAKVASSSIRKYLYQHGFPELLKADPSDKTAWIRFEFPRIPQSEVQQYVDAGYKTFAIVRNPYDRICSCYRDKIVGARKRGSLERGFERYNQLLRRRIFDPKMSFEAFIRTIYRIPDFASDAHFRSQATFIPTERKTIVLDNLFKIEDFDSEFSHFLEELALPKWPLVRQNQTTKEESLLLQNPEAIPLIRKRYKKSFDLLPYDPRHINSPE